MALSPAKPAGYVPNPSRGLQQRVNEHGVLDPVSVRPTGPHQYEILSNPTIWVAAGRAGLHRLPVTIHHGLGETEAAEIVRNHYQQKELNPIEEARDLEEQLDSFGKASGYGSVTELAHSLGLSRTKVAHTLRLLALPLEIQENIERGELSAGQARPLIGVSSPSKQRALAREIIDRRLSVRAAEELARAHRQGFVIQAAEAELTAANSDVEWLERRVGDLTGCPFEIRGNEAVFNFFGDYEVLQGLLTRLGYRED